VITENLSIPDKSEIHVLHEYYYIYFDIILLIIKSSSPQRPLVVSFTLMLLMMMRGNQLADRAMHLLASCNPKDLSQCNSVQRARDILGRLRELARKNLENERA
jgi:hypothetical protein